MKKYILPLLISSTLLSFGMEAPESDKKESSKIYIENQQKNFVSDFSAEQNDDDKSKNWETLNNSNIDSKILDKSTIFDNFAEIEAMFKKMADGITPKKEKINGIARELELIRQTVEENQIAFESEKNQLNTRIENLFLENNDLKNQNELLNNLLNEKKENYEEVNGLLEESQRDLGIVKQKNFALTEELTVLNQKFIAEGKKSQHFQSQVVKAKEVVENYKNFIKEIVEKQEELKSLASQSEQGQE